MHSSITLTETYHNINVLKSLSQVDTDHADYNTNILMPKECQTQVKKMLEDAKNTNKNKVQYKIKEYFLGRFWADKSCFQNVSKRIMRLTMGENNYISVDIINCQPSLLEQECLKYNIPCDTITQYNADRQQYWDMLGYAYDITQKDAKQLFCALTFGGSFKNWLKNKKIKYNSSQTVVNGFVNAFQENIYYIQTQAVSKFPEKYADCVNVSEKLKKKKEHELFRSALGLYLQNLEKEIMVTILKYVKEKTKFTAAVYKFDEIIFDQHPNINEDFVVCLKKHINVSLGYNVGLKMEYIAPTIEDDEWLEKHKAFEIARDTRRTDEIHCENILQCFQNKFYKTDMGLIMYLENKGHWTNSEDDMMTEIAAHSSEIFVNVTKRDKYKTFMQCFVPAFKLAKNGVEILDANIDIYASNKGFLLFQNGVLDMKNQKILPWKPSYFFMFRIEREYLPLDICGIKCGRKLDKQNVIEKLFDNPITEKGKRDYVLEVLARGVAGEITDKEFLLMIGESNCGKGMITRLCQNALGSFVTSFDGKNLIGARNGAENEKNNAWLVPIFNKRLAFVNEVEMGSEQKANNFGGFNTVTKKFNANTIKCLVSGGDKLSVRDLHQKHSESLKIPVVAKLVIMVNDTPEMDGMDGIPERARYISFDRTSSKDVSTSDNYYFPQEDGNVLNKYLAQKDTIDAFINVLCDYYEASTLFGRKKIPDYVKQEVEERAGGDFGGKDGISDWVNSKYEIYPGNIIKDFEAQHNYSQTAYLFNWTKVKDNYVQASIIHQYFCNDVRTCSTTKFGKELKKMGFINAQKRIDGRKMNIWVGLRKPDRD